MGCAVECPEGEAVAEPPGDHRARAGTRSACLSGAIGDPEVAQVGITPAVAAKRGIAIKVYRLDLAKVERAVIDGEAAEFAALYTHNGVIIGATFVAAHAGESLPLLTLAVAQKMSPADLAAVIHCYSIQVEAIQRAADKAVTA
jgi:pyruvate/2-oxoglutarate dehydrogenase complex dihydrolipoamide dehydrogenase (E3) component